MVSVVKPLSPFPIKESTSLPHPLFPLLLEVDAESPPLFPLLFICFVMRKKNGSAPVVGHNYILTLHFGVCFVSLGRNNLDLKNK